MSQLIYPRPAATIAARARMALGAYRAVPGHEAAHELDRWLHDMWSYSYFALHNDSGTARWTAIGKELFDALQLLKTAEPAATAQAAMHVISRFEHATGTTPGAGPEALYSRAEAERAAYAAFDRLRLHIPLDHRNDREFVAQAFLAFLDNLDSPYPYASHNPDADEHEDEQGPTG